MGRRSGDNSRNFPQSDYKNYDVAKLEQTNILK